MGNTLSKYCYFLFEVTVLLYILCKCINKSFSPYYYEFKYYYYSLFDPYFFIPTYRAMAEIRIICTNFNYDAFLNKIKLRWDDTMMADTLF